jgi:DNA replication protein DnaC
MLITALHEAQRVDIIDNLRSILVSPTTPPQPNTQHTTQHQKLIWYSGYLKERHSQVHIAAASNKWLPSPTQKIFNLAIIKKERIQRGKIDDEFVRQTIRGQVDDILLKKSPIELEKLFENIEGERKVILIDGAPGSGKSTLTVHICQRWSRGELFQEFTIVILVQLQDPAVQSAQSIADLIPCPDIESAQEVASAIKANLGRGILWILDGWDELPSHLREKSLLRDMITPSLHSPITLSSVIVTSRPVSSGELSELVSSRIEVLPESGRSISAIFHLPKSFKNIFKLKCKERSIISAESSRHEHRDSEERSIATNARGQSLCILPLRLSTISHLQLQRISRQDKPQVYMLHISKIFQDQIFARYAVGSPSLSIDSSTMGSERVLMLVGATGTGKTTLINGIANYIYGTKWEDEFRLKVIHNEGRRSQAYCPTKHISAYTFPELKGSPLPYTLTVIDTPGFGNTEELRRDRQLVEQINAFFSVAPPGGIAHLHGIGFVVQASNSRLTPMQLYVFNSILSIFGRDVKDNIFVIITFCDAEKPIVLSALKEASIPFTGKGFKFNNSALFAHKESSNREDADDDNDDDDDYFNSSFFNMGMRSFKQFFKQFEKAEPKSFPQTKERKQLEILIKGLRVQIVYGIGKLIELKQEQEALSQHQADVEANQNFTYKVTVTKYVQRNTKVRVTNCVVCNHTCHYNCVYNRDKYNCKVFQKEGQCTVCPGKCHHRMHVNQPFYYESEQREEERTYEDLKARYDYATSKYSKSELVLNGLDSELTKVQEEVVATVKQAHKTLQRLEEIALNPDPLSETDYIKLCIEAEKREAKPGWEERALYFEELLIRNKYISTVKSLSRSDVDIIDSTQQDDLHSILSYSCHSVRSQI